MPFSETKATAPLRKGLLLSIISCSGLIDEIVPDPLQHRQAPPPSS